MWLLLITSLVVRATGSLVSLSVGQPQQLRAALHGPTPHVILCEKPGAAQSWSYLLEEALTKLRAAQRKKREREGATDLMAKVQVRGAVLDCSQELPQSTATVLKKYGRKRAQEEISAAPVIIVNPANGGRTLQLSPRMFTSFVNDTADESSSSSSSSSKRKKKKKGKTEKKKKESAQRMVQVDATKLARTLNRRIQPKLITLKTPGDLNSACLRRIGTRVPKSQGCVVIVQPKSGSLAKRHARVIRALSATYRLVPFVTIDASKFVFSAHDDLLLAANVSRGESGENGENGGSASTGFERSSGAPRVIALYPNAVAVARNARRAKAKAKAKTTQRRGVGERYRPGDLPLLPSDAIERLRSTADDALGVTLSESAHLIKPNTNASDAWRLFKRHRLTALRGFSAESASALFLDPKRRRRILTAIDGVLYPWAAAAPYFAAWGGLQKRMDGATLDALAMQYDKLQGEIEKKRKRKRRGGGRGGKNGKRGTAEVPPLSAVLFDNPSFNVRTLGDFLAGPLAPPAAAAAAAESKGGTGRSSRSRSKSKSEGDEEERPTSKKPTALALSKAPTLKLRKKPSAPRRRRKERKKSSSSSTKAGRFKQRMASEETRAGRKRMGKVGRERARRRDKAEAARREREAERREEMAAEQADIVQTVGEGEEDEESEEDGTCVEGDETCIDGDEESDDDFSDLEEEEGEEEEVVDIDDDDDEEEDEDEDEYSN